MGGEDERVLSLADDTADTATLEKCEHVITLSPARSSEEESEPPLSSHKASPNISRLFGALMVAFSAFLFSAMGTTVRVIAERYGVPSFEILFFRCMFQLVYSLIASYLAGINPFGERGARWLGIVRGASGGLAAGCFYYGVTHIPMADASVLMFSSPIWTPVLARVVLNERVRGLHLLAMALGFLGVVCIARPSFVFTFVDLVMSLWRDGEASSTAESTMMMGDTAFGVAEPGSLQYLLGVGVSLMGAILASVAYTAIRKSKAIKVHFLVLVQYFASMTAITSSILFFIFQRPVVLPSSWTAWALISLVGVLSCAGQTCLNKGAQAVEASTTSLLRNLDVVFAVMWQVALWADVPGVWSWVGVVLIILCATFAAFAKGEKPPASPAAPEVKEQKDDVKDLEMANVISLEAQGAVPLDKQDAVEKDDAIDIGSDVSGSSTAGVGTSAT